LVAKFFDDSVTDPMIDFVKEHVFDREAGLSLMNRHHHIVSECFDFPCPSWKGTLLSFISELGCTNL
jgi:hypothetical protein